MPHRNAFQRHQFILGSNVYSRLRGDSKLVPELMRWRMRIGGLQSAAKTSVTLGVVRFSNFGVHTAEARTARPHYR